MTKNHGCRDRPVMMSSVSPSAKYSCSGSPPMFWNGRTAIEGLSGSDSGVAVSARVIASALAVASGCGWRSAADGAVDAVPVDFADEAKPALVLRANEALSLPLSPTARRAALMRELSAASEMARPCQMVSISSSLLTIRWRFRMR